MAGLRWFRRTRRFLYHHLCFFSFCTPCSLPRKQPTIWPFAYLWRWCLWTQQGETKFQRLCLPWAFQHQKVPHVLYFVITLYPFVLKSCWLVTLSEVLSTPTPSLLSGPMAACSAEGSRLPAVSPLGSSVSQRN